MAEESRMGERISRIETRLDGVAHDVAVLKIDVGVLKVQVGELSQEVKHLGHRLAVTNEHMDDGFKKVAESFQALSERMDRGFARAEAARLEDRRMFMDILGNHEGRIVRLEGESRA